MVMSNACVIRNFIEVEDTVKSVKYLLHKQVPECGSLAPP